MIHGFVEYSLVTYWDELKKVLRAFGDTCKDFDIPECSEVASELIKEGFTLEFMTNAVIRPILNLKNPQLLLDWWKKVEGGDGGAEPPPETEVFKTQHTASFIFLFFKIGTEVNVFSHLGQKLFTHMKEAMFSDVPEPEDSEEEEEPEEKSENGDKNGKAESGTGDGNAENFEESNSELDTNGNSEITGEKSKPGPLDPDFTSNTNGTGGDTGDENGVSCQANGTNGGDQSEAPPPVEEEKVITSMYGKVYKLKPASVSCSEQWDLSNL